MPSFDPNIMLGILQGAQSGQAFPTSVQGIPEQMLPKLESKIGGLNPGQLNTLTTGFQNYAPTWQAGQSWNRNDILGSSGGHGNGGFGGFGGWNRGGFGGNHGMGGQGGSGLRGGGGK